jgi:hypothetical protein
VTRSEAEQRAKQLQSEHPDPATHRFLARESADGGWEVAKVAVPEQLRRPKLTPTIQATPVPSPADDPRTGHEQRAPGTSGGV